MLLVCGGCWRQAPRSVWRQVRRETQLPRSANMTRRTTTKRRCNCYLGNFNRRQQSGGLLAWDWNTHQEADGEHFHPRILRKLYSQITVLYRQDDAQTESHEDFSQRAMTEHFADCHLEDGSLVQNPRRTLIRILLKPVQAPFKSSNSILL